MSKILQDRLGHKDLRDRKAQLELLVHKVHPAQPASKVHRARKVFRVQLVQLDWCGKGTGQVPVSTH